MKTLVVATFNKHKLREFKALCRPLRIKVLSLESFPDLKPPQEDGKTFAQNAAKKASVIAKKTGLSALADDSGICVEALGGKPGVDSAHYAGPERDDLANTRKILKKLKKVPLNKRKAHYHCSIAVATPKKVLGIVEGKVFGFITQEMIGNKGFGYDPIFYYPQYGKTFAQIPLSVKNNISHRSRALKKAVRLLSNLS